MKRRTYIRTVLAGAVLLAPAAEVTGKSIELHVDLTVDPAKEAEMLKNFHTVFRPAASKQPGYIKCANAETAFDTERPSARRDFVAKFVRGQKEGE